MRQRWFIYAVICIGFIGLLMSGGVAVYAADDESVEVTAETAASTGTLKTPTVKISNTGSGIKVSWNKIASAKKYVIYRRQTGNSAWKRIKTVKKADTVTYTDKTVVGGKSYYYGVRAVNNSGYSKMGSTKKYGTAIIVKTPKFSVYSKYRGQARISWSTVKGVDGFEIYCKEIGKKEVCVAKTGSNKKDRMYLCELKVGKTAKIRVRSYKKVNGKTLYSDYVTKKVKISGKNRNIKGGDYSVGSVYGPYLSSSELADVKKKVKYFVSNYIDPTMPQETKIRMAHDYLCWSVSYADDWSKNRANSAWGALVYGEAQCSGYARAMKALCDGMGIGCYYVHANSNAMNPSHQWNQVKIKNNWYIVDVQFDDSVGGYYMYLVSDSYYSMNALMDWDRTGLPSCKKNYFD